MKDKNFSMTVKEENGKLHIDFKSDKKLEDIFITINGKRITNNAHSSFCDSGFVEQFFNWWSNPDVEAPLPEILLQEGHFDCTKLKEIKKECQQDLLKNLSVTLSQEKQNNVLNTIQKNEIVKVINSNSRELNSFNSVGGNK